jgi:methanogenic corrinoid protein MtbC1
VGTLYERSEALIVELIAAAEAMKVAMEVLKPEILKRRTEIKVSGRVVLDTVAGDIHDISKNIVAAFTNSYRL